MLVELHNGQSVNKKMPLKHDRQQKIKSFLLHECAQYFNQNWKESDFLITLFDIVLNDDNQHAKFIFTFNNKINDYDQTYKKVNQLLQKFKTDLYHKSDFRKMPIFEPILSDDTTFQGIEL